MVSHEINICKNKQSSTCVCMVKYLHVVHKGSWWLADVYDAFRQTYIHQVFRSNITFARTELPFFRYGDQTFTRSCIDHQLLDPVKFVHVMKWKTLDRCSRVNCRVLDQ